MNWLPSPRALIIFGILMALFVAAYWACAGHAEIRTVHEHYQERTVASVAQVPGFQAGWCENERRRCASIPAQADGQATGLSSQEAKYI